MRFRHVIIVTRANYLISVDIEKCIHYTNLHVRGEYDSIRNLSVCVFTPIYRSLCDVARTKTVYLSTKKLVIIIGLFLLDF